MSETAVSYLETAIANYRAEVLAEDAKALRAVIDLYTPVRARLMEQVAALEAQLAEAGDLTIADALRLDRAQELLRQTEDELARLAPKVEAIIDASSRRAVILAGEHAQGLTVVSALQGGQAAASRVNVAWTRLNTGAVEQMVGRLSSGSPLRTLLRAVGADAATTMAKVLTESVALGRNPRATAALLAKEVNVPAARLLTIARTESLNAYRGATVEAYRANEDIIDGFIWVSARSSRSCLACLAMDGTKFPIDSTFNRQHPNCRCSYRPSLRGIEDAPIESGRDWFDALPQIEQRKMIPATARADFDAGRLGIDDFVQVDQSRVWGESRRQATASEARRNASRRERRAA